MHFRSPLVVRAAALSFVAVALIGSTAARSQHPPKPEPVEGKIDWVYSYDEGRELAAKHDKPLFIVFRCER